MGQNLETASRAWREAAEDLTIAVVAPYPPVGQAGDSAGLAVAWIESFGSAHGIVVAGCGT
jgi:hypothetical protein